MTTPVLIARAGKKGVVTANGEGIALDTKNVDENESLLILTGSIESVRLEVIGVRCPEILAGQGSDELNVRCRRTELNVRCRRTDGVNAGSRASHGVSEGFHGRLTVRRGYQEREGVRAIYPQQTNVRRRIAHVRSERKVQGVRVKVRL